MSVWSIIIAIIMLGVLVTIHELGHFWVARLLKIKVYEVSIFIGPKLLEWRWHNVDYTVRGLPFGAYVRFTDFDENGDVVVDDDPLLLINSPRWKRLIVALAGPFMNLLLGITIFAALFVATGYPTNQLSGVKYGSQLEQAIIEQDITIEDGDMIVAVNGNRTPSAMDVQYELETGARPVDPCVLTMRSYATGDEYEITLNPTIERRPLIGITHVPEVDTRYNGWRVEYVYESQNNGNPVLKVGDYLVAVDGISVADENFEDLMASMSEGDTMTLTYYRNGVEYSEECVRTMTTITNERGAIFCVYEVEDFETFMGAVKTACTMPYTIINLSIKSIGDVFEGEEEVYNMVGGPIGMTAVVSDYVDNVDIDWAEKIHDVVQMAAIISIGLMFTNLLPIPGLDGNQLILIIVEMVMGHALSKKSESVINSVGMVLLICLALFAFASDIIRIILE